MANEIPYRPSNGTEGDYFMAEFCARCKHYYRSIDPVVACEILVRTLGYEINEPEYPPEWISDADGDNPRCTAFEVRDDEPT